MKLSQFNFKLPKDQVALYPHKAKHVVKTASGERTFEITRRDAVSYTHLTLPTICSV